MLERWLRLTFTGAARQPARLVFNFTGSFECRLAENEKTEVTHAYEFRFNRPFGVLERRLARWLQEQIEQEMHDLAIALKNRT